MSKQVRYLPDSFTIKAADTAMQCQNACNGIAVIGSLHQHLLNMHKNAEYTVYDASTGHTEVFDLDTETMNQHPITILYLDKLTSLARTQGFEFGTYAGRISKAYAAVEALANGQAAEWEIL